MKFLRGVILLVLLMAARESIASITCDFIALPTGPKCAPYFILDSAINTSSSTIIRRRWELAGPRSIIFDNALLPTFQRAVDTAGHYCLTLWTFNAGGDSC